MSWNYLLSDLVLPPTSLIALTLVGAALLRSRPRLGLGLIVGAQLLLFALAVPAVAFALARTLEPAPLDVSALKRVQAIVILGGGRHRGALEWGGETVNDFTLERLRYGAQLARTSGLPVYVTGGMPDGGMHAEGDLMAGVLAKDYGVRVKWIDNAANTTRENALMAAQDLTSTGVQRIALVTSAMHMPRSVRAFEAAGFTVVAAPTGFRGQRPFAVYQLMPSAGGLRLSNAALREWFAQAVYRLRGS